MFEKRCWNQNEIDTVTLAILNETEKPSGGISSSFAATFTQHAK